LMDLININKSRWLWILGSISGLCILLRVRSGEGGFIRLRNVTIAG
jgi:hypothetical protein